MDAAVLIPVKDFREAKARLANVLSPDDRIRLAGPKGVVEYMESTGVTLLVEGRQAEKITDLPQQRQVFVDYLNMLYNGKKPLISRDDMFRSNRATLVAHQAAIEKRFLPIG